MTENSNSEQTVYIVDDDPAIRFAMQALLDSVNIDHEIFASADEFLQDEPNHRSGCLVLDIRMPGLGGLELQDEKQTFDEPPWLGEEVTQDPRYYNVNLVQHPYKSWAAD